MSGQLFVFSAPSGAGKSTIVKALKERTDGTGYSVSHTSRKPRATEKNGIDYHFVKKEAFITLIDAGAFAEWAEVYEDLYGTSFSGLEEQTSAGLDVLLDLDTQGAQNIKNQFENSVLVYVLPPSLETLERRLRERGTDDENVIRTRMEKASRELRSWPEYDYIVINDELEGAIEEAQAIILAERCRTPRREASVRELFGVYYS
jgi:guanylate kinase